MRAARAPGTGHRAGHWPLLLSVLGATLMTLIAHMFLLPVRVAAPVQPNTRQTPTKTTDDPFDSLGHVRPFHGADLHDPAALAEAVSARSHRNELILMVTDGRMRDMLMNLIANLRALRMEHYLVLASDATVCATLVAGGDVRGCAWSSAMDADRAAAQVAWGVGAGKEGLWWLRWHTMATLGKLGINVLSTDVDVCFHANPYPTLKGELGLYNLVVQNEGADHTFPSVNVGLVYLQNATRGGGALWVLEEMHRRLVQRIHHQPVKRCHADHAPAVGYVWEQSLFNDALESAACACVVRHRGLGCTYPSEQQHLAEFDGANRPEFTWLVEDDDRPRLTPTAHEDMLPLRFPSTYRRRWRPLHAGVGDHRHPLDKVAMAPKWLFALLFETYGWIGAAPSPVVATHFLTLGALKRPIMQAHGLWHPSLTMPSAMRVLGLLGPPLRTLDRAATDATVARLAALALATGRTPLLPRVACDAPWILREAGSFRDGVHASGPPGSGFTLEVVAAACHHVYDDASDADTCCYYLPMQDKCTSPEWVLHPSDMRHLRHHFDEHLYTDAAVVHVERLQVGNATTLTQVQAELGGGTPVVWLSWDLSGSPALNLPTLPPTEDQRARDFAHACPLFATSRL